MGEQKRKLFDYKEKEKKLWNELNKTIFEEEIAMSRLNKEDILELLEVSAYYKLLGLPYPETIDKSIKDFKATLTIQNLKLTRLKKFIK